jgi:hypothetical protein
LPDALNLMNQQGIEYSPVVDASERYLGLLERPNINRVVLPELLSRKAAVASGEKQGGNGGKNEAVQSA